MVSEEKKKLADAPKDQTFWMHMGQEIKNLKELAKTLEDTPPKSFKMHVNENKNDFANWIKNVLEDTDLAEELYKTTDFSKTVELVKARVSWLEAQVKKFEDHEAKAVPAENIAPVESAKEVAIDDIDIPPTPLETEAPKEEIAKAVEEVQSKPAVPTAAPPPVQEAHPFTHVQNNVRQAILGGLIGFIIGALIAAFVMMNFVCKIG
jgi:hypothetical protein